MAAKIPYNSSGFFYVRGREKCLFSNGIALDVEEFHDLDSRGEVIQTIVQRKNRGDKLYDFEYACEEGVLRETENKEPRRYRIVGNDIREVRVSKKERSVGKEVSSPPMETESATENIPLPAPGTVEEAVSAPIPAAQKEVEEVLTEPLPSAIIVDEPPPIQTDANPPQHRVDDSPGAFSIPYWKTVPFIVETAMTIVAIGGAIMSAYHGSLFLIQSGKEVWVSWFIGIILICFSSVAFTAARFFFEEKDASKVFGFIFICLGLSIIAYSIFSTVAVNFNQFTWEEQKETEVLLETSTELAAASTRIELLAQEVERLDEEIATLEGEASTWRNQSWRLYEEFQGRLDRVRERREVTWDRYVEAGQEIVTAEAEVASDRGTVYSFVARLFGLPEDVTRFIIYAIPACAFDILAPFGLTVVLLLRGRRERKGAKK